ncbi:hypothetical protein PtB15_9B205 [Puccinia triticina]|nr:hypothetical protein PtB15_9B205 [Puccinia triticina]
MRSPKKGVKKCPPQLSAGSFKRLGMGAYYRPLGYQLEVSLPCGKFQHDGKSNNLLLSLLKESAPTSTSHHATPTQKAPLTEEATTAQKAAATRRAFAAWKSAAAANAMPGPTNTKKVGPTSKGKVGTRRSSRTGKL